ncbi:MAG: hypothetical protein ACLRHW_20960 [Coprobacillus cateniformis]
MSGDFFEKIYNDIPIPNKTIHIFEHGRHPAIISNKSSVVPMVINFLEDTKK